MPLKIYDAAASEVCESCIGEVKPVGEPDVENPHVPFDERGWEKNWS
jgi:hypothetical protein